MTELSIDTTYREMRRILIVFFLCSAVVQLTIASLFALGTWQFVRGAVEVRGDSLGVEEYSGGCGAGRLCQKYRTTVTFTNAEGVQVQSKVEGDFGEQKGIRLLYNPANAHPVRAPEEISWMPPIMLAGVAIAELVVVLPMLLFSLKRHARRRKAAIENSAEKDIPPRESQS